MTSAEIRKAFLQFFEEKEHKILPSASLIPEDPTILLTIAGMVPFKSIFEGRVSPPFHRAVTVQKCVRISDLDKVGYTSRHHTFFEMLGNFSFGDYFKKEACSWAWEFLTQRLLLPPDKLWISVHHRDEEAFTVWREEVGISEEKIVFLGDEDNFWASGPVGPCGYCSEIYYDTGEERGCGQPDCRPGCDCDRYLEIWNLVFMEFDRGNDGLLRELPHKNIDTGMGLERITSVMQKAQTDFETDLFLPIIEKIEKMSGISYQREDLRPYFRIIADHIRAITFLIGDGVYPANEGRGYVLRRLIRRAHRYGHKLSLYHPFLPELAFVVIEIMGHHYPELKDRKKLIAQVVLQEERKFEETLQLGMGYLKDLISRFQEKEERVIPGREIFYLYDTYGFPPDIASEILEEEGLSFSQEEFETEMERQKTRARRAYEEKTQEFKERKDEEEIFSGLESEFVGYEEKEIETQVLALFSQGERVKEVKKGEEVIVVLEKTPFYPERGGQEGDKGFITSSQGEIRVEQVSAPSSSLIIHRGVVEEGIVREGEKARAQIEARRRKAMEIHHTVTHLLHRALREVLGEQVKQTGSWVGEEGLRFDFTHFAPLSSEEIKAVESLVNEKIFEDLPVQITFSTLEEAQKRGVIALFEEKYEEMVRIVRVGNYSAELCGGTHLAHTAQALLFKITSESSIGRGLRRIEGVAGPSALSYLNQKEQILQDVVKTVNVEEGKVKEYIEKVVGENKELKKALEKERRRRIEEKIKSQISSVSNEETTLVSYLGEEDGLDLDFLKEVVDHLRPFIQKGVVVLGLKKEGKIQGVLAGIGLPPEANLGRMIKEWSQKIGGGGGGRPHLAQFGGLSEEKWEELISLLEDWVESL
ncbi:alanine--tRNA ligase [Candidatus Sordicultor fermentans]|uniref:alanine--tRNA ligase n=1 Tax=Candidatus Sordicultor fermentans TaxID=1953203 RepID=UPI002A297C73|nr:alanine--tRNA ligase [Atribacterota bacterium]MDI9607034.1 alanine--tRNA ligase [Atribacterota bacterium]HOA98751.1 alanine--tRNA ligase [Candidatus Atribacteria bacterium]